MKIVHIYYSLNYGGIESLLVNLTNWQVQNNQDVSLILINKQTEANLISFLNPKVNLIEIKRRIKSKGLFELFKLNYKLIKNKFEIIHVHAAEIGNIILPFFYNKIVLHIHATSAITNRKISKFNKCIVISNAVKNVLKKDYNINNTEIIYNGIDFKDFKKRSSNKLSNKIICVGSLVNSVKNQKLIIEQFFKIKDIIESKLHIVGDGPDFCSLKKLIEKLNLNDRVILLGSKNQDWIKNSLKKYDLFIQASKTEGLGIAAIESAAAMVPILLSDIEGHLEVSDNGKYCELFSLNDRDELSKKIIQFYNNPLKFFENAKTNISFFENRFGFINFNEKIIKIYKSI